MNIPDLRGTAADSEMSARSPVTLTCPQHRTTLSMQGTQYVCSDGCTFPIVDHIPRFVGSDNYAAGFGVQWNAYRRTQLDSVTGTSVSRARLTRVFGSLDVIRGKTVLEAGCGAGRFTEILLEAGASVVATDLSSAVSANYANCHDSPHYFVCQSNILALPFPPGRFDAVICLGVVQHTPNPEETMSALCAQVAPGGQLIMDHYSYDYPTTPVRRGLRFVLLRLPPGLALRLSGAITRGLWPFHRLAWHVRHVPLLRQLAARFLRLSPVVDHHHYTPTLSPTHQYQWALLDTHDTLTDRFKHLRSADEIKACLTRCGMTAIEAWYGGNGVEVRAMKPA